MNLLQSMGVKLSEIIPEIKTAVTMVRANSWSRRPMIPSIKIRGIKTEQRQMVMERMVKLIWREPLSAAVLRSAPFSTWRAMFSKTTMASSTRKPIERVRAKRERISMVKPSSFMMMKVPRIDMGMAIEGMRVLINFPR